MAEHKKKPHAGHDQSHEDVNDRVLHENMRKALRELRTEIMDLNNLLTRVKDGNANVKDKAASIEKTYRDVETLITEIGNLNQQIRSDTVRHIFNVWEQMRENQILSKPAEERAVQEQLQDLTVLQAQCSDIVLSVGKRTIPSRINDWLKDSRPGHYLPFHLLFSDELPLLEDRIYMLNYMASAPKVIENGIVNAANGLIYKYEKKVTARTTSFLLVILIFVIALESINILCHLGDWFGTPEWPLHPEQALNLMTCWIAILLGSVTHIGVSSVKRSKVSGLPPVIPVNDLLLYTSARKGDIILKILIALFALIGLALTGEPDEVKLVNAFLVGYSLDSVFELFGTTIEQKAEAQVGALKEQLGISTGKK